MNTGGQIDAIQESGEPPRGPDASSSHGAQAPDPTPRAATVNPQEICTDYGSDFVPPAPLDKAAVAISTLGQWPLNARRITPERGSCGWYVWGGEGRSSEAGFFQSLQVVHLLERCPQLMPYLALAPGWRVRVDEQAQAEIRPPHDVAPPANITHAAFDTPAPRTPPVKQWVWLSILLHVLAIALFGNTTGSGERQGERQGRGLNVRLQGPVERGSDSQTAAPQLRADTRLSSLDRRQIAEAPQPVAAPSPDTPPVEAVPAPAPAKSAEEPPAPVIPPLIATEVVKPVTTFVVPVAIPEMLVPPQPAAAKLPEAISPLNTFTPPKPAAPPKLEREIVLPTETIPRLAAPVPARIEREVAVPIEQAPRLKAFVPPKIEVETPTPPLTLPQITPLPAAVQAEREMVRPTELLPRLAPVTPPVDVAAPTVIAPRFVPPAASTAPVATPEPAATTAVEPAARPSPTAPPAGASTPPATTRPAPDEPGAPRNIPGETLTPRGSAAVPSLIAPASGGAPRIDLDAVRQRARELAREGAGPRTLLPFNVKPKEEIKTKEQQAFDKALKRPDCRDAYSGMGLAAVVPLLWDSVSEKGCKW